MHARPLAQHLLERGQRRIHPGAVHVQVGHAADPPAPRRADAHVLRRQRGDHGGRVLHGGDHDVRLLRQHVQAERAQTVGQHTRVLVVLGQPLDVVVERVEASGRQHSGLPHRPAQHLLPAPGLLDQLARAAQHRAHRRSEPLGEVEPGGVEAGGVVGGRHTCGHDRVQEPGAVEMGPHPMAARHVLHGLDLLERPHPAAAHVGGLLDRHEARARHVAVIRPERLLDRLGREHAAVAVEAVDHRAGQLRRAAGLGHDRVRPAVKQQLVAAGADVQPEADPVAHRAAREEQARLVPEQLGHPILEAVDGRVLPLLLVTHLRAGDGLAHAVGGACLRVAVEVDQRHRQPSSRRSAAIRSTARAASSPWWRLPPPTRASACSIVLTVSTPNAHGTPVSSDTRAIPLAASWQT